MTEQLNKREQAKELADLVVMEAAKQIKLFNQEHPNHPGLDPEYENLSYAQVHSEMIRDDISSGKETDEELEGDWELLLEYQQYLGLTRV